MLLIPKRILQSVKKNNTSAICHVKFITLTDFWRSVHRRLAFSRPPWSQGTFASVAKKGVG
jgi:hypothetical protein